jgi:membrane dipeptidase
MRLIDLHTDWLLQYAHETTVFEPALYPRVARRLSQAEGYLQGTSAAILSCYRNADDWARQADPWHALGELLARLNAEFSGRLLFGADDLARWRDDAEGLCWGLIGIEGFDPLIREPRDLDRLPDLFDRGVRLFQPVYGSGSVLGGSSAPGDDRGLTDLGRQFLRALHDVGGARDGPRPLLDLAHLCPSAVSDALDWFEADEERGRRLTPVYSHGAVEHSAYRSPRALTFDHLRRLRALGGVVGFGVSPPFYETREALRAGIMAAAEVPFRGRSGGEGIAIGTDFLGVDRVLPGLGNATEVVDWVRSAFEPAVAPALVEGNARALLERALGTAAVGPDPLAS